MTSGAGARDGEVFDFTFISSNFSWGGSEELWSETAAVLAGQGHRVTAYKNRLGAREGNVAQLRALSCRLVELAKFPLLPRRLYSLLSSYSYSLSRGYEALRLYLNLRLRRRPSLVILSQGGNHDGWLLAAVCRRLGLPFVLVSQKATDLYWPDERFLSRIRMMYAEARHCFFVAADNRRLTEEQIGAAIPRASVVRNPFKVAWDAPLPWPSADSGYRLACVGRLYPKEKGQDLILRVLASDKWRRRPVSVTFFGEGEHRSALQGMADFLKLASVRFAGHADDIPALWAKHHALVLPSRAEGLPLVVVEAMLSGRVAIATELAGNAEAIEDGETGFLAAAPTEAALDEAMERAWRRRDEWPELGLRAAAAMRALVPADPPATFAERLIDLARGGAGEAEAKLDEPFADAAE